MKRFYIILLACYALSWQANSKNVNTISAAKFGAIPNDGINDAKALRSAAEYCRSHSGTTLIIPAGVYDFIDNEAIKIERDAISGAYGRDDMATQNFLFRHDGPYVKALDFKGCKDLKIKAYGAILYLQGWYEVISFVGAQNIEVDGLSILYKRPPCTEGVITAVTDEYFDMKIDPQRYCYLDSIITGRIHFVDHLTNHVYWSKDRFMRRERLDASNFRIYTTDRHSVGDLCIMRHGGHYRPAIMLKESSNITLKDVKIYSHPGMGVVGHLSNNITLDGLQIVPQPGNWMSTTTDATHFTSCSGNLIIRNCKFRGCGDDCTNIHNYYYCYYPQNPKKVEIKVEDADLHALSLDYPTIGDTMLVVNRRNMAEYGKYIVQKVDTSVTKWQVFVYLDKPLNTARSEDYYMINITRFPKITIVDNVAVDVMSRFLIKSSNLYFARNFVQNAVSTGIKLGAEISWHEGGPVNNVIIENNFISSCGYTLPETEASCVGTSTESPEMPTQVNKNIIIRNNTFYTDRKYAIVLHDTKDVTIENNLVGSNFNIKTDNCKNIKVTNNH